MRLFAVLCLLAAAAVQVYAMPNGAPAMACAAIQPAGPHQVPPAPAPYVPNSADQSMNPFQINLTQFQCPAGIDGYCYAPGETYQLYLYGTNCEQYRGLLVQGRQNVTGDPVGRFSDFTSNTRESNCTNPGPEDTAVTHSNPSDKTFEVLTWTAPSNGTGHIAFHYAVVVILQQGAANIWYAPAYTQLIYENENAAVGPPLSNTICPAPVASCPVLTVTDGSVTYTPEGVPPLAGAVATYTCNENYTLNGASMRTCQDNGTWTEDDPTCSICPLLQINDGTVSYEPVVTPPRPSTNTVGTYTCDNNRQLDGPRMRTCLSNGTWMPPVATMPSTCGATFTTAVSIWSLLALLAATYLL